MSFSAQRSVAHLIAEAARLRAAGHVQEAIEVFSGPLASGQTSNRERAVLLREAGACHLTAGSWKLAHEALELALSILDDGPEDRPLAASIRERQAWALFREGRLVEACAIAREVCEELAGGEDRQTLAGLYNTLGGIAWQRSNFDESIAHVSRAAELYEQAGDQIGLANTRTNLGVLLFTNGRWPEAEQQFLESERIRVQAGHQTGRCSNLLNLGVLKMSRGDHAAAREDLVASLQLSIAHGEHYDEVQAEVALAHLNLLELRIEDARRNLENILSRNDAISDDERVQAAWMTALLECHRTSAARGVVIATEALEQARQHQLVESEADCCRTLAYTLRRALRFREAENAALESIALARRSSDPYRRALGMLELAAIRAAIREQILTAPPPERAFDEATRLFEELGAQFDLSRVQAMRHS